MWASRILVLVSVFWGLTAVADDGFEVKTLEADRVYPGTTLITQLRDHDQRILEIDHQGNVLWSYEVPSNQFTERGFILDATPTPDNTILYTLFGGGIYEIDRDGNVLWQHKDPGASHDVDLLLNGNLLYNRGWAKRGEACVREINRAGETVWEWNGLPDFRKDKYVDVDHGGWMHTNAVTRKANGDTLISIRNFNRIVEVDKSGEVVWSCSFRSKKGKGSPLLTPGIVKGQRNHEPEILKNGNILLSLRKPTGFHEIDRETCESVWWWTHPEGGKKLKTNRDSNRLPNGNTLVVAAERIIEIAPNGDIVWAVKVSNRQQQHRKQFHKAIRIGDDGKLFGG